MAVTHYLVTGTSETELERLTGLRGRMTGFGVLVEKPKPFNISDALAKLDRTLNPDRCTCGLAIIHRAGCPQYWAGMT